MCPYPNPNIQAVFVSLFIVMSCRLPGFMWLCCIPARLTLVDGQPKLLNVVMPTGDCTVLVSLTGH